MNQNQCSSGPSAEAMELTVKLLQESVRKAPDMIFVKNTDLVYVAASDSFGRMVGCPAEEIIGKTDYDIFADPKLAEKYRADDKRILAGGKNIYDMVEPLPDLEGQPQYATTSKEALTDSQGRLLGIKGVSRDLGRLRSAQRHFWTELQHMLELGENDWYTLVADLSDWQILETRAGSQAGPVPGRSMGLNQIIAGAKMHVPEEYGEALDFYSNFSCQYCAEIYNSGKSQIVLEYLHRFENSEDMWMQDIINLRTNPENGHLYIAIRLHNVEEQRKKAMRLREEAQRDGLTGLLNRHYFIRKCGKFLADTDKIHAFFMIDVDNFKKVNDTYGHQAGDSFLISLAQVLSASLRSEDLIARLGGDEFVALMKSVPNVQAVRERAEQILQETRRQIRESSGIEPSISIGISMYPKDGSNVEELYGNADIALYKAKIRRDNRYEFFEDLEFVQTE